MSCDVPLLAHTLTREREGEATYLILYGRRGLGATQDSVNLIANVTRYRRGLVLYYRWQLCRFSVGRLDLTRVRQPLALSTSVQRFTRERYVRFQCFRCSTEQRSERGL